MPRFRRRRRRPLSSQARFLLWFAGIAVAVTVVLSAVAGVRIMMIARDLREARGLIDTAAAEVQQARLGPAREHLAEARALLTDANGSLFTSPELDIIGWAPVVSSNLNALRDAVGHALSLVSGGLRLLEITEPLESASGTLEVPLEAGRIPLAAVADASREVQSLLTVLPGEGQRPGGPLLGPVRELQDVVYGEAEEQREHLQGLSRALRLLTDMGGDGGPRRYVLAVANTAEMRGSGGMVLSYGVLESANGLFDLSTFGPIDELFLRNAPDSSVVPIQRNEAARWAGLEPTRLFRNANLVPDFAVAGPRLEAMYEVATGLEANGVIQIDAAGLAAILRGIGPVDVPGVGTVTAENVIDLTLNQIYFQFPEDQEQRREVLGEIAEAAFIRLTTGDFESLRGLGEALADATAQRHIVLSSSTQEAATAAAELGIDGDLPNPLFTDSFLLTVQNFGRDKLDYYIDTEVEITGVRPAREFAEVEATVTVTNTAPQGQEAPSYVFGNPEERGDRAPGTYVGVASLYVPVGTALLSSTGQGRPGANPVLTTENDRTVVGFDVEVPPGESVSVTMRLELIPRQSGPYLVALAPLPRVRPTMWRLDLDDGEGGRVQREGPLLTPERVTSSPAG